MMTEKVVLVHVSRVLFRTVALVNACSANAAMQASHKLECVLFAFFAVIFWRLAAYIAP